MQFSNGSDLLCPILNTAAVPNSTAVSRALISVLYLQGFFCHHLVNSPSLARLSLRNRSASVAGISLKAVEDGVLAPSKQTARWWVNPLLHHTHERQDRKNSVAAIMEASAETFKSNKDSVTVNCRHFEVGSFPVLSQVYLCLQDQFLLHDLLG